MNEAREKPQELSFGRIRIGRGLPVVTIAEAACQHGGDMALAKELIEAAKDAGADIILLDNMNLDELRASVRLVNGRAKTEASGGVNLSTVRGIAETGVDFISVGALTHSARSVDIALDFVPR